jgi:hypothetical protein
MTHDQNVRIVKNDTKALQQTETFQESNSQNIYTK